MSTGVQNKAAPSAGQHADGPRLLADVGGTNARFALETKPGEISQVHVYPCAEYPGIAEVIKKYLKFHCKDRRVCRDAFECLVESLEHSANCYSTSVDS